MGTNANNVVFVLEKEKRNNLVVHPAILHSYLMMMMMMMMDGLVGVAHSKPDRNRFDRHSKAKAKDKHEPARNEVSRGTTFDQLNGLGLHTGFAVVGAIPAQIYSIHQTQQTN